MENNTKHIQSAIIINHLNFQKRLARSRRITKKLLILNRKYYQNLINQNNALFIEMINLLLQ